MHINYLKWDGFKSGLQELINQIRQCMKMNNGGICIIKDVPINDDNVALLSIANAFNGTLLRDTRMPARAMEANCVIYRVEEDLLNTDEYAYSATNQHFPLHTDCAHFLYPPQLMMLLCCRPSSLNPEHGKTILTHVNDIVEKLTDEDRTNLTQLQFPWWQSRSIVRAPILSQDQQTNRWFVRFNQATLEREMNNDEFRNTSALQSFIKLLQSIETDPNNTITLTTGDLLIVHNQRILHGRTAFPSGSSRLLKRIRIRVPDL
ncbi:hypothetical protein I4U23_015191 [Adineta vaga]|nr:hypothetical protein I4U23_015191 [Adineta vaga]